MPIGAWAQIQYWAGTGGEPPVSASVQGQYVGWQMTVLGSLFGSVQGGYERLARRLGRLRQLWALTAWSDERYLIMARTIALLDSPTYPVARMSVTRVARSLGFNKPTAWQALVSKLKQDPEWTENMWRHYYALQLFSDATSTVPNADANVLVELAYHGYVLSPQRTGTWPSPSRT